MKSFCFLFLLASSVVSVHADATAYEALHYFQGGPDGTMPRNVYLVRGEGGEPQPREWIVYRGSLNGPTVEAAGIKDTGRIVTAAVPTIEADIPLHAEPLRFSMVNVDSDAAWKVARQEARKENFQFNRINYELSTSSFAGVPVWTMVLFNEKKAYLGELTISAATGEVIHPLKLHSYKVADVDGAEALMTVREPWLRRAVRSVGRWFSQTGTTYGGDLKAAASTTEEIVVGRRSKDEVLNPD